MNVKFREWDCELRFHRYGNGRVALILGDTKAEGDIAVATVNLPGFPLQDNQVLIKDYSENRGVLAALEEAGVVRATGATVDTGHARIAVCDLLVDPPWKQREAKKLDRLLAQLDTRWKKEKQERQPPAKDRGGMER